jgi:hypothetical protein
MRENNLITDAISPRCYKEQSGMAAFLSPVAALVTAGATHDDMV